MANINSIEAAKIEAKGLGAFHVKGTAIILRTNKGVEYRWSCRTEREAQTHLRLFRRAPALVA